MANQTAKVNSERDYQQAIRYSFNDVDASITSAGFLIGKVGRKVTQTISTTNVANDTVTYDHSESGVALYSLKLIYTDGTQTTLLSAERTA